MDLSLAQRCYLPVRRGERRLGAPLLPERPRPASATAATPPPPPHLPPTLLLQAMCGRSRVSLAPDQVLRAAGTARWVDRDAYQPSYNCSPGAATPVVTSGPEGVQVHTMRCALLG